MLCPNGEPVIGFRGHSPLLPTPKLYSCYRSTNSTNHNYIDNYIKVKIYTYILYHTNYSYKLYTYMYTNIFRTFKF